MTDIDLRTLPADEFVLHFGGRASEVDAFTFSNSLISISEAMQEINRQINPDFRIDIVIDGVGTGSFRAQLKTFSKSVAGLFKHRFTEAIIIGLLTNYIYAKLNPTTQPTIIVNDDSYIIQSGNDRIILPKECAEAQKRISDHKAIDKHITRTFEVLNEDSSVTDFGFVANIHDSHPVALFRRESFGILSAPVKSEDPDDRHYVDERTPIIILKAIFERGDRRWQFVWNNIRISAPIKDTEFFDKLAAREYEFGQGDILDVTLRIYRTRDEMSGVFINDKYEVTQVHDLKRSAKQAGLFDK
jgi:hypothetical protein